MAGASAVEAGVAGRGLVVSSVVVVIGDSALGAVPGHMSDLVAVVALHGLSLGSGLLLVAVFVGRAGVRNVSLFSARIALLHVVFILEVGALLGKMSLLTTIVAFYVYCIRGRAFFRVMAIVSTVEALVSGVSLVAVSVGLLVLGQGAFS